MPIETFKELDFKNVRLSTWKEAISRQWEERGKFYRLAFGEKQLIRYYNNDNRQLVAQLKERWSELWNRKDKMGFCLYVLILFLWSFPILCFFTHPFLSIASFFLLILFRFFTKIVFQESWAAVALHPFGCAVWLATFAWWLTDKTKKQPRPESPGQV